MTINGRRVDAFTAAYIEAALWSSNDEADERGGEPLDRKYGPADLAPETLDKIVQECAQFQATHAVLLSAARSAECNGHDFWSTRNGHGVGFWDRGLGEVGDKLTDAAHACGERDLYVGDDGRIYQS